jgi:REP element-mobilizing transposase RayT
MEFRPKRYRRRSIRLKGFDYTQPGSYFVTVCTYQRELLFGEVIEGQMRRNALGDIVHNEWFATERIRPETRLDAFIVMPNHIHGIIQIIADVAATQGGAGIGARRRLAPGDAPSVRQVGGAPARPKGVTPGSIGAIVGQIKSLTKKAINKNRGTPGKLVWQPNYHEHVIRNEDEMNRIRAYICNNAQRWPWDRENPARESDAKDEIADIVSWDDDPSDRW